MVTTTIEKTERKFSKGRFYKALLFIIIPYIATGIVIFLSTFTVNNNVVTQFNTMMNETAEGAEVIALLLTLIMGWFFGVLILCTTAIVVAAVLLMLFDIHDFIRPEKTSYTVIIKCECGSISEEKSVFCAQCGRGLKEINQ